MTEAQLDKPAQDLARLNNLSPETAGRYAALIGDTPDLDEDGRLVVRDDAGDILRSFCPRINQEPIMTAPTELSPPMSHVFVDFENVHQIDLSIVGDKSVSFILLVGASQTKLNVALVEKMMERAASVHLVRLTSSGKNALDFALSYYVGRAAVTDPTGYFHVISKDTGFDPLIEHLRSRNIRARRHDDFSALSFTAPPKPVAAKPAVVATPAASKPQLAPKKVAAKPRTDALSRVLARLRANVKNRPSKKTALVHDIQTLMAWTDESKAAKLVGKLEKDGHLSLSDKGAVSYSF